MNGTLVRLRPGGVAFKAPAPRREDRWSDVFVANKRRFTAATALVLLASAVFHGMLVATALLERSEPHPQPPQEIPVEIVQEVSKPPEPAKKAEAPPPQAATSRKAAAPPEPPPALKPTLPPPTPPTPPAPPKGDASLKAMQDELAELKAEHEALEAERSANPPRPSAPAGLGVPAGLGALPDSFQAIALPSEASEEGEAVGYAAIVFSQLAKAKAIGGEMGQPGTAGVRFVIDTKGALIGAELVHSSGIKQLDDEALAIVHRAAPFPMPPAGAQRDFSANVSFVAGAGQ